MTGEDFTDAELQSFMDESLSADRSSQIEAAVRSDARLRERLEAIREKDFAGVHSVGSIWRRSRITCPSRDELGMFLLHALEPQHADYVRFHIETVGCRFCEANLEDLRTVAADAAAKDDAAPKRRRKIFQTSVGRLKRPEA